MIPRAFWIALGAGAGVLVVRRAQRAARAVTPAGIADRAGASAQGVGEQLQTFWATVRVFAAEREAELRSALGLDGSADIVDAHTVTPSTGRTVERRGL